MSYFKTFYKFMLALIVLFTVSCSDDSPVAVNSTNQAMSDEIDRVCDSILTNAQVPGMVVGVWLPEKNFTYLKAKGYNDPFTKTPMQKDHHFRIGSNTKSFVTTIVLQLIDEGKLKLDDKLSVYFPDFPRADEVTIHQLMNMSSGIFNYTDDPDFQSIFFSDPLSEKNPIDLINIAKKHPYYFDPGTNYHYSNTNTIMLGEIIQQITKKSLNGELHSRIFSKYGLTKTSYATDHKMPANFIKGWSQLTEGNYIDVSEMFNMAWVGAAGAIVSDIYDVKKWVELISVPGIVSDSLTAKRFEGIQLQGMPIEYRYGYGVFSIVMTGYWGHNGEVPGYTSLMMHNKTTKGTIVIFFNSELSSTDHLFFRIYQITKNAK